MNTEPEEEEHTFFGVPRDHIFASYDRIATLWIEYFPEAPDYSTFLKYYASQRMDIDMHPKMSQMLGQIVEHPDDYQKLEKWKRTESFPDYALSNFGRLKRVDGKGDILYAHATMKISDLNGDVVLRFMINDGKERSNPTLDGLYDEVWGDRK